MIRRVSLLLIAVAAALVAGCGGGSQQPDGGGGGAAAQEESRAGAEDGRLTRVDLDNGPVVGTSYVSPLVEVFGDVRIGERSFVAGNTVFRAAPERMLSVGNETNAQDNIIARSLKSNSGIGDRTSLAHHAIVKDSEIGDFVFVGFHAEVLDSTVKDGVLVSAGALIDNVTIPEDALVPPGAEITTQRDADALGTVGEADEEFKRAMLDVNAEFAENYIELYREEGYEAAIGIGPNPVTSFNPERVMPQIPAGAEIGEFARILGEVRIGENADIGERASIRADEGSPIVIGESAVFEERVTFHALVDTGIEVGELFTAGDGAVVHGPLVAGNGVTVGDHSVVFRVVLEDDVTIGNDVVIQGPALKKGEEPSFTIPAGTFVPDDATITDEASLREVLAQQ